jgi:hypothetical protein
VKVVDGHANLLEIIRALRSPGSFARRLDRGQQQGNQDANDRDDNQ